MQQKKTGFLFTGQRKLCKANNKWSVLLGDRIKSNYSVSHLGKIQRKIRVPQLSDVPENGKQKNVIDDASRVENRSGFQFSATEV